MKHLLTVLPVLLVACSGGDEPDRSILAVWGEGNSWHGDDLRVYFRPRDPARECAGAVVRLERNAPPRPSELHLTFLAAPLSEGKRVDAVTVPTSELGHPYVQIPVDPSIFENHGRLLVHVPQRSTDADGVQFTVSESVLSRD